MPAKLSSYQVPESNISALFKNTPEAVPSVDELERIQSELKMLRQLAIDRAKKAGEDLRNIEDSMRRIREREKGKLKSADKIKRERDCTSNNSDMCAFKNSWSLFISCNPSFSSYAFALFRN